MSHIAGVATNSPTFVFGMLRLCCWGYRRGLSVANLLVLSGLCLCPAVACQVATIYSCSPTFLSGSFCGYKTLLLPDVMLLRGGKKVQPTKQPCSVGCSAQTRTKITAPHPQHGNLFAATATIPCKARKTNRDPQHCQPNHSHNTKCIRISKFGKTAT